MKLAVLEIQSQLDVSTKIKLKSRKFCIILQSLIVFYSIFLFFIVFYYFLYFAIFYCIVVYCILLYFILFHIIFSHIILSRFHTQGLSNFRLRLHHVEQESYSCLSLFQIKFYFKKQNFDVFFRQILFPYIALHFP